MGSGNESASAIRLNLRARWVTEQPQMKTMEQTVEGVATVETDQNKE